MSERFQVPVLLLILALISCSDPPPDARTDAAAASNFDTFARRLYDEMRREPLDPEIQTEVGLFGDMSVVAGEVVVMGQYRYRVDSSANRHAGHIAFQIRDTGQRYNPVPVVLRFVSVDGTWRLESAAPALGGTALEPDDRSSERYDDDTRANSLERSVNKNLNSWVDTAVERLSASRT